MKTFLSILFLLISQTCFGLDFNFGVHGGLSYFPLNMDAQGSHIEAHGFGIPVGGLHLITGFRPIAVHLYAEYQRVEAVVNAYGDDFYMNTEGFSFGGALAYHLGAFYVGIGATYSTFLDRQCWRDKSFMLTAPIGILFNLLFLEARLQIDPSIQSDIQAVPTGALLLGQIGFNLI